MICLRLHIIYSKRFNIKNSEDLKSSRETVLSNFHEIDFKKEIKYILSRILINNIGNRIIYSSDYDTAQVIT